ncbi:uncharacterized protein LOC112045694 [Bicyclus anynana]|uniref:Uncharacterized protein LOC112045694 n=1 Tax=Bicyclus anynana TaxID=110368 RepID=A0ABM3M1Q2_BICAN|nr:uncharacterized protein LOC112045694 [Bicyclus anynana]
MYTGCLWQLRLLHYCPLAQQAALGCLAAVARRSAAGARGLRRHVASLEETATCKAPLATLIGTICEHHPSAVEDEVTRIWRVFLNLLDSNKYSVTVRKAILDGVRGLLTHFGAELPTRELNVLYEQLLAHLDHPKCEAAALQLLAAHARLFRERVAGDARVRALAWRSGARPAILALYGAAGEALAPDAFQKILDSEVSPRTRSARFYERYTALRVRALAGTGADATDAAEHADVRALQHRVRCGHVDWDTCEAVCWCIHARVPFSECVLQAAILCYERFPANKRKEVVVHSLLRADAELRSCTVKFLIAESVRAVPGAGWLRLWRDMFDDEDGRDAVVAECCDLVLDDVLHCVTDVLHSFVDDESSSDALARLLALVLDVLRAHPARVRRPLMARALRRRARTHAIAAPAAILLGLHLGVVYEDLPLHTCADEAMLLKFSEALLCAPDTLADKCPPRDLLTALEIIFSNNETEPALLSRAVQQLDTLLSDDSLDESDSERVRKIVVKLEKLTQFVGKKSKFERILHRDIVMFLGKHGQELAEPSAESDRMLIYNLQNSLVLDIPHNDGTIKLNLQAVLYAAIQREDLDALNMLLRVITANLSKTRERHILQTALIRVLLSLSHCGASSTAVSLCDASCAVDLFKYAVLEKSTRSRKILLDATEVLLRKDGQILENILECFLQNENDSMYQSSDIAIFILNQMKENNALSHQYLHTIIDKMIRVEASCDVIKMAADLYLDKCNQVDDLPRDVIKTLDSTKNDVKKCAVVVEFVKRLLEIRLSSETDEILDFILDVVKECDGNVNLTLFMGVTEVFGAERVKKAVLFDNLLEKILNTDCRDEYKKDFLHIKLDFYNTYSDVIQQAGQRCRIEDSEITIQNIIEYGEKLTKFLSDDTISVWFRHQPIDDITRSIERYDFKAEHEDCVRAMRVMLLECKRRDALPVVAVKCWAECVGRLDVANVGRSLPQQTAYLMDMLAVAFDYLSDDEILAIINKGDAGHQFLRTFMPAVFPRLTAEPYVLARGCSALLRDVLSCAASTDCRERVLGFVDALWPEFAQHSTTEQKLSALSALRPAPVHSRAARWALDAIASPHTSLQHKIVMLDVLPNDVKYSLLAKTLCPHLPARLDELTGLSASAFQTLLDALADSAYTGDTADTLLDTVVTVAAGEPSSVN